MNGKLVKIGKKASKMYPQIKWSVSRPSPEIEEDYGQGFIIRAGKGEKHVDYFILIEDPRIDNWIHMIANQLEEK